MPSSLRTARTHTAPTTRRKGTSSFPGLHAADDTCPSILAGVFIRYMRDRTPVAHKGEWRPKQRRTSKTTNAAARGGFRKIYRSLILFYYIYIYILLLLLPLLLLLNSVKFILNSKTSPREPPKMKIRVVKSPKTKPRGV